MRSVEAVLAAGDDGVAVIHNYLWGSETGRVAQSTIAHAMTPPDGSTPPAPIDQLDQLR